MSQGRAVVSQAQLKNYCLEAIALIGFVSSTAEKARTFFA